MSVQTTDIFCPDCGYNLRGIEQLRCPECGSTHSDEQLATNRIPWTYRRGVGAFLSTVAIATFRPSRLALCFNDGVTWQRGRSFRWICALVLSAPAAALLLYAPGWELLSLLPGMWSRPAGGVFAGSAGNIVGWLSQAGVPWYIGTLHWPVVLVMLLCTALALSLLPVRLLSFARLPAGSRESILAAGQYVCGSAVGGAVAGAAAVGVLYAYADFHNQYSLPITVFVGLVAAFWINSLRCFCRQAERTSGAKLPSLWLVLPPLLLLVLFVWLIFLPSALGLLIIIYDTLH